jgi:plastocyanin
MVIALTVAAVSCSSGPGTSTSSSGAGKPPAAVETPAPSEGNAVVGKAPAATNGVPSIVILEPTGEASFPPQPAPPAMDQVSLTFIPATLIVRTGQPTEFRNSDDVLHNVRVRNEATKEPAFNVAIPTGGTYQHTFQQAGFYDVGCDIHPGMAAIVVASTSPYAVMADNEGRFTIADVQPGAYLAKVYSGAKTIERAIDVTGGRTELSVEAP